MCNNAINTLFGQLFITKMLLRHFSIYVHLQGACSLLGYFNIIFKLICIKNLSIKCIGYFSYIIQNWVCLAASLISKLIVIILFHFRLIKGCPKSALIGFLHIYFENVRYKDLQIHKVLYHARYILILLRKYKKSSLPCILRTYLHF
jgi:hypothetical protein